MKSSFCVVLNLGLLALATGCSSAPPDTHAADVQAIKDLEVQWNKDYQAKDLDKLQAHYTDDAVLIGTGAPPSVGKDAIHSMLKEMVDDSALALHFEASHVDVSKSGDVAYTQGSYNMTMTDPETKQPVEQTGSYVTVYKKQADGSWKAISDIASSGPPPNPPEPASK